MSISFGILDNLRSLRIPQVLFNEEMSISIQAGLVTSQTSELKSGYNLSKCF